MSKTAIVTGASRGIGYQTCIALAQKNCNVIAIARSANPLEELAKTNPDLITPFTGDLTSEKDVKKIYNFVADNFGTINILVNNAGALVNKQFQDLTLEDWQHMLDINLLANVHLTKSLLALFSESSHIVNISSMGGFQGSDKFPGLSAYSVAKGAVSILSECLATELAPKGISVNALCLGAVQTEMLGQAFPGFEAPVSPEEMGKYIANFALDGSSFYNGKVLPVALTDPE
ncbi:MAG: SDR family oxidoreductase [Balneolaceae bacterium]|nr:SDR family oxidoreductase [Balneolaceae bacterium]